jgi:hypothetical protein
MYFDGENISSDASLVIYINSTNIPPIMIINRIYEHQNLLSLYLVSFLVGLRTYQHPCTINCLSKFLISTLDQTLSFPDDQKMENEKINAMRILVSRPEGAAEGRKRSAATFV